MKLTHFTKSILVSALVVSALSACIPSKTEKSTEASASVSSTSSQGYEKIFKSIHGVPWDRAFSVKNGNNSIKALLVADPLCPGCQAFEKTTVPYLKDVELVVVPIALPIPSHAKSPELISRVICQPQDKRAAAWTELMTFTYNLTVKDAKLDSSESMAAVPVSKPENCNFGIDMSSELKSLTEMGLKGTPTIYAPNGQSIMGGNASTEDILKFLKENQK